jgi:hypothetical protein
LALLGVEFLQSPANLGASFGQQNCLKRRTVGGGPLGANGRGHRGAAS